MPGNPDFPHAIWSRLGPLRLEAEMAAAVRRLDVAHVAPRRVDLARAHLGRTLAPGRVLIHGAGTHTAAIWDTVASRPGVDIVGVIDHNADRIPDFRGVPVVAPDRVAAMAFDYVIVGHDVFEPDMARVLAAAGIPAGKVRRLYTDADFAGSALRQTRAELAGALARPIDYLLLDMTQNVIVDDDSLARVLPPEATLRLRFGRAAPARSARYAETVDLLESLALLEHVVRSVRPKLVYMRLDMIRTYLPLWFKSRFPELRLVADIYDYSILWSDDELAGLFHLDPPTIRCNRLGEYVASRFADLVVSKRGGPDWTVAMAGMEAPYVTYFPMVREPPPAPAPAPAPDGRIGLLYAGFLPPPSTAHRFASDYNFLPLMEELVATGRYRIDLFNASHREGEADRRYQPYLDRFCGPGLTYRPAVAYPRLLEAMPGYDFGWLCLRPSSHPDHEVGIGNRLTGYVSGGLPALIDAGWTYMSALVKEYGAGVVVPEATAGAIDRALAGFDRPSLSAGVVRLRRHMTASNDEALARIAEVVDQAAG